MTQTRDGAVWLSTLAGLLALVTGMVSLLGPWEAADLMLSAAVLLLACAVRPGR